MVDGRSQQLLIVLYIVPTQTGEGQRILGHTKTMQCVKGCKDYNFRLCQLQGVRSLLIAAISRSGGATNHSIHGCMILTCTLDDL